MPTASDGDVIDRRAWVGRHDVRHSTLAEGAPVQVGNGELAATVDLTGMQTFPGAYPAPGRYGEPVGTLLGCQTQWAWHSTPSEQAHELADTVVDYDSPHGRVGYVDLSGRTDSAIPEAAGATESWLRNNPHRLMLGLLGLTRDGQAPDSDDLADADQRLDLWTGTVHSRFRLRGADYHVTTAAHPQHDTWAIRVSADHPVELTLRFPYGSEAFANAADWSGPDRHTTTVQGDGATRWTVERRFDNRDVDGYRVELITSDQTAVSVAGPHEIRITTSRHTLDLSITYLARDAPADSVVPDSAQCLAAAAAAWPVYWSTGGAVELVADDPRAAEIERRVVLSSYLTAVNCAGSLPPQETGLMVNSWRGRFHLEMHWWHAAHFPVWGRPELLERSLGWYDQILPRAEQTADDQGLRGARWPKQIGPDGRESPSDIGPFLIWQQPHPIHLAELIYRARPEPATLERWSVLVERTAEFMAAYAHRGEDGRYHLGPPLIPAQESYRAQRTTVTDPTFELAYWQWALRVALDWRRRLGLAEPEHWREVADGLALPPIRDGVYAAMAVPPYTVRTDHPSMLCALGVVPTTDLIDPMIMSATLDDVLAEWDWDSTWGWDYPVLAMCATRLGRPEVAVDTLLTQTAKNTHLANGHNRQTDALPLYLPGNGGLLVAVALMAAGWDGGAPAPGFPDSWTVRCEGVQPLPA